MTTTAQAADAGAVACAPSLTHTSALGDAPANKLLERVSIRRRDGLTVPRSFGDYVVTVANDGLPGAITYTEL